MVMSMERSTPQSFTVESYAAKIERARDALSEATLRENTNRDILTKFDIFDFTGMDKLSSADVAVFSEIIFHTSNVKELTPNAILSCLQKILSKARGSWRTFKNNHSIYTEEDKAVFWYVFWESSYSKKPLKIASPTSLMTMVSYYTSGFRNMLDKSPISVNMESKEEYLCLRTLAQWLRATEKIEVHMSVNASDTKGHRKRPRVNDGTEDHQGDREQLQDLQSNFDLESIEHDAAKMPNTAEAELDIAKEELDKANGRCMKLSNLLDEATKKSQEASQELDNLRKELRDSSEEELQIITFGLEKINCTSALCFDRYYDRITSLCLREAQRIGRLGAVGAAAKVEANLKDVVRELGAANAADDDTKARCYEVLATWGGGRQRRWAKGRDDHRRVYCRVEVVPRGITRGRQLEDKGHGGRDHTARYICEIREGLRREAASKSFPLA